VAQQRQSNNQPTYTNDEKKRRDTTIKLQKRSSLDASYQSKYFTQKKKQQPVQKKKINLCIKGPGSKVMGSHCLKSQTAFWECSRIMHVVKKVKNRNKEHQISKNTRWNSKTQQQSTYLYKQSKKTRRRELIINLMEKKQLAAKQATSKNNLPVN